MFCPHIECEDHGSSTCVPDKGLDHIVLDHNGLDHNVLDRRGAETLRVDIDLLGWKEGMHSPRSNRCEWRDTGHLWFRVRSTQEGGE